MPDNRYWLTRFYNNNRAEDIRKFVMEVIKRYEEEKRKNEREAWLDQLDRCIEKMGKEENDERYRRILGDNNYTRGRHDRAGRREERVERYRDNRWNPHQYPRRYHPY